MITLFHHPKSRSTRFIFLLEELEAPYQIRLVTMRKSDGTGAVDPAIRIPMAKCRPFRTTGSLFESPPSRSIRRNGSRRTTSDRWSVIPSAA